MVCLYTNMFNKNEMRVCSEVEQALKDHNIPYQISFLDKTAQLQFNTYITPVLDITATETDPRPNRKYYTDLDDIYTWINSQG